MSILIILLGTNINPEYWTEEVVKILEKHCTLEKVGRSWRTKAEGPNKAPDFINRAIKVSAKMTFNEWKTLLRKIEDNSGRKRSKDPDEPRTLDLDIVWFNNKWIENPGLKRPYGILPLADVSEGLKGPENENFKQLSSKLRNHPSIIGIYKS